MALTLNGHPQPIQPMVQNAMFYPNTYINFTQAGEYTKHYYNGTERISSRLGEQQIPISVENEQELEAYKQDVKQMIYNAIGQHLYDEPTDMQEGDVIPLEYLQVTGDNNAVFYYHSNHLSSTMYVTDMQQSVVQSFLYAPYGEIISEYNTHAMGEAFPKYSFNAKELDEETGMYYYEARYYAPPTFISRDPLMSEKHWLTPYHYCSNNPVGRVDPTGMMDDWYENELTGEVFYNSQMGRNDAGKGNMTGEGWQWMGDNNMFDEVNDAFVNDNLDFLYSNGGQFSPYNSITTGGPEYVYEMRFGGNSEAFMSKMGYDKKPLTAIVDVVETSQIMDNDPSGAPIYNVDRHDSYMKVLTSTYVKKNTPSSYKVINKTPYVDKQLGPLIRKTTWSETRRYNYGKSNYQSSILPTIPIILNLFKDFIPNLF